MIARVDRYDDLGNVYITFTETDGDRTYTVEECWAPDDFRANGYDGTAESWVNFAAVRIAHRKSEIGYLEWAANAPAPAVPDIGMEAQG